MVELDEEMNGEMFSFSSSSLLKSNIFWPVLNLITILHSPAGPADDEESNLWKFLFKTRTLSLKYDLTSPLLLFFFFFLHSHSCPFPFPVSEDLFENAPQPFNGGSSQAQDHREESTKKPPFLILGFEFQDVFSGGKRPPSSDNGIDQISVSYQLLNLISG